MVKSKFFIIYYSENKILYEMIKPEFNKEKDFVVFE